MGRVIIYTKMAIMKRIKFWELKLIPDFDFDCGDPMLWNNELKSRSHSRVT